MKLTDREAQIILTIWGTTKADFETLRLQTISEEEVTDLMCRLINFRIRNARRRKKREEATQIEKGDKPW